jgi:alkaline phosphatase
MRMIFVVISATLFSYNSLAQNPAPRTHSHNDYEQKEPFFAAYREGFNSIEADVWLVDGKLLVGHDQKDLQSSRTLEDLYLKPISARLKENKGRPYVEKSKGLQLMIDIKSEAVSTLDALTSLIRKYPDLAKNKKLTVTISGNRPSEEKWASYPAFIYFDGRPGKAYAVEAQKKLSLISDSYAGYLLPGGKELDVVKVKKTVGDAHALKKPFRFWGNPDDAASWQKLIDLGVDFINTDHIAQ